MHIPCKHLKALSWRSDNPSDKSFTLCFRRQVETRRHKFSCWQKENIITVKLRGEWKKWVSKNRNIEHCWAREEQSLAQNQMLRKEEKSGVLGK